MLTIALHSSDNDKEVQIKAGEKGDALQERVKAVRLMGT
jgi:hypothetical protein